MAVMVDPPPRDSADEGSAQPDGRAVATVSPAASPTAPPAPRLAEPPIPGGRVEALMGRLIRVLAHSRLARPLPAVTPHLPDIVANLIMYASVGLCVLGLAMMLWANSRGWSPNPRRVFWTAAGAVAVLVNITPVGSSDAASYAAYGRIAALGYNPYTYLPISLPHQPFEVNPYT